MSFIHVTEKNGKAMTINTDHIIEVSTNSSGLPMISLVNGASIFTEESYEKLSKLITGG